MSDPKSERIGIPARPFFFTVDQVASLLQVSEEQMRLRLIFYMGRSVGAPDKTRIIATNMMPEGRNPEWRILDKHLYQFLRFKGYKFQSMGYR